jgi:hypothetical protein
MKQKMNLLWIPLILLVLILLLVGCVDEPNLKKEKTIYQFGDELNKIEIVTIESCEYLYGPWGNATVLTHKGNCKNPIHNK